LGGVRGGSVVLGKVGSKGNDDQTFPSKGRFKHNTVLGGVLWFLARSGIWMTKKRGSKIPTIDVHHVLKLGGS